MKVEEGNKEEKEENSYVRSSGLNSKNVEIMEKGEKVVRKEKENSLVRDSGLNNKIIGTAAEKDKSRAKAECKFRMRKQKEAEAEEDEYDGQWSRYEQRRRDRRNYESSKTKDYDPRMSFTVRSVSDGDSEQRNSFVRNNGLNESNPIYKLEGVLKTCYQDMQSHPDMYGIMRRDPKKEANPLLCNLKT